MIKYIQLNKITDEQLTVWNCLGEWGIFENDIVKYYCMGDSVESDRKDKYNVYVLK